MSRLPALRYLMNELKFKANEWSALPDADKDKLKQWAEEEQDALGIPAISK